MKLIQNIYFFIDEEDDCFPLTSLYSASLDPCSALLVSPSFRANLIPLQTPVPWKLSDAPTAYFTRLMPDIMDQKMTMVGAVDLVAMLLGIFTALFNSLDDGTNVLDRADVPND